MKRNEAKKKCNQTKTKGNKKRNQPAPSGHVVKHDGPLLLSYVRTYVRTYACTYVRTYIRTYVCTHVHTYVRTNSIFRLMYFYEEVGTRGKLQGLLGLDS